MAAQELLQDYVVEVQEHLLDMEKSLLLLEHEGTNEEQVGQVFRAAHSIKGASACMGFEGLTNLTHELESLISAVRSSARSVPSTGISLLLKCVDLIAGAVEYVKQKGSEPPLDQSLLENLRNAFSADGAAPADLTKEIPVERPENIAEMEGKADGQASFCALEGQESQAAIVEEDEELLSIFVSSFQDNYSQLLSLLRSSNEADIDDNSSRTAGELVERLISSARYMDYEPIVVLLEEWKKNLDSGSGVRTGRQEMLERLDACAAKLGRMIPQLSIPSSAEPGSCIPESPIEEDDQELFSIFLDSFQQNFSRLAELISVPGPVEINLERACELTNSLIQSSKYMDYTQVIELLEEWNDSLSAFKDRDERDLDPLQKNFSTVGVKLRSLLTGLKLPRFQWEKREDSPPVLLDDETDFLVDADLESAQSALFSEEANISGEHAPDKQIRSKPASTRPAKERGKHTGGKDRPVLVAEEIPQNAATLRG